MRYFVKLKGRMELIYCITFWILLISSHLQSTHGQTIPCDNGHQSGYSCIIFVQEWRNWDSAQSYCENNLNGHLVTVQDSPRQSMMENLMRQYDVDTVWIGLKEETTITWKYVSDGSELSAQGCYNDEVDSRDLPYSKVVEGLTPGNCQQACSADGYLYYGVQKGESCYCGNEYGKHGITDGCTIACKGDEQQLCGGWQKNFIYQMGGAYGDWAHNQPNNHENYQTCAAVDFTHESKLADQPCEDRFSYICDIPTNRCSGSQGGRYKQYTRTSTDPITRKCYFHGTTKSMWFTARKDCMTRGGDLLKIDSKETNEEMMDLVKDSSDLKDNRYNWVGVTRRNMEWSDGSAMMYNNLGDGVPDRYASDCFRITKSSNYKWSDTFCSQKYNFFCEIVYEPPTTTTTTTSTTTTTTTPTTTTTTPTTTTTTPTTTTTIPTTTTTTSPTTTTTTPTTTTTTTPTTTTTTTTAKPTPPPTRPTTQAPTQETTNETVSKTTISKTTVPETTASVSTTVATVPSGGVNTPDSGAASGTDAPAVNNTLLIALICVVCFLLLAVGIAVLIFVLYKRAEGQQKVCPHNNGKAREKGYIYHTDGDKQALVDCRYMHEYEVPPYRSSHIYKQDYSSSVSFDKMSM